MFNSPVVTRVSRSRATLTDYAIAAFRIVVGFLFLCHGTAALWGWPAGGAVDAGEWPWWWAGIVELVCGAALVLGLGTRIAAFLGSGAMAYAYFWGHQSGGVLPIENGGDSAVLFCWAMFLLVFLGPGALSLDRFLRRRPHGASVVEAVGG